MRPTESSWPVPVLRWLWIVGFTIGTLSHVWDILQAGTHVYDGYAGPARAFWLGLTVLDPVIVFLLWRKWRCGIALGVATLVFDLAVNVGVCMPLDTGAVPSGVVRLALFTSIVLATAPTLWRWFSSDRA